MATASIDHRPTRRDVLRGSVGLAATALAGCAGRSGEGGASPDGGPGGSTRQTTAGATLRTHPAATDLAAQPTLGPDPVEAEFVIVAFEDPSCPTCRRFEEDTLPEIRSGLIDPGRGSFVFRGYPVVYAWGVPATRALEATYDRGVGGFWALKDFYFRNQFSLADSDVLDRTRQFLEENTDLDGGAVVADVESGASDAAVRADLEAGRAAGATATPSLFLFRDGSYVTTAIGSVSYSVIANALGV